MNYLKLIAVLLTAALVSACGPRLQQVKNYIPPVTGFGMECLNKADMSRNQCEVDNQSRLAACHVEAEEQANVLLAEQEKQYTYALEEYIDAERGYELAFADYEEQQRLLRRDGELAYVRCSKDVNMTRVNEFPQCKRLLDDANRKADRLVPPAAPAQPRRPSYDVIVSGLKRECNSVKVNCTALYDEAYLACGGQIDVQTICVANCD